MSSTKLPYKESYLPVAWEYREVVEEEIIKGTEGKVFFFNPIGQVDEARGKIVALNEQEAAGVFVVLDTGVNIRLDQVITLFGKVGAAYEAYNAYANACMDCTGGHENDV